MKRLYSIASGILASLLLVCSCSSDEDVNPEIDTPDDPDVPSTEEGVTTTVSFTGSVSGTDFVFSNGDAIAVSAYTESAELFDSSVKYTYSTDGGFTSTSPIEFIESEDGKLSYLAVYPYMEIPTDKVASFTVEADQSTQANYNASDLMSGAVASTSSATPALSFSRLLSNVVLQIESDDFEVSSATVTLYAVATIEYNLSTFSSSISDSTSSILMFNDSSEFNAIVVPQTFSVGTTIATIEAGGDTYSVVLDSEFSVGGGQEVTIPITIFDGTITYGNPIVNDWGNGSFGEEEDKEEDVDDGTPATISIADLTSPYSLYYSDLGGSRTIGVISNKEQISYTYDSSATWLSISTVNDYQALMALVIDPNETDYERSVVITITAGPEGNTATTELTITQGEYGSSSNFTVGDLVYDDTSGAANGIICYVSDDGTQVMALSFDVYYGSYATTSLASDGYDTGFDYLYSNSGVGYADDCMSYIQGLDHYTDEYYPAFAWAASLGDGWYIPTRYDWINCIMPAFIGTQTDSDGNYMLVTDLNDAMVAAGGTSYDNNDYVSIRYWTCNLADANAEAKAYITKLCGDTTTKVAQTSATPYARAVKYVMM